MNTSPLMTPLDGEGQKKRVVGLLLYVLEPKVNMPYHAVLFFRLGHRRLPLWPRTSVCINLSSRSRKTDAPKDETDAHTHVPLPGHELWSV